MSESRILLNPMTGKPFAWDEYYSATDTILTFGLETDFSAHICGVAAELNIKLIFRTLTQQELTFIPVNFSGKSLW